MVLADYRELRVQVVLADYRELRVQVEHRVLVGQVEVVELQVLRVQVE